MNDREFDRPQLVAIDVDGTLARSDGSLSEKTCETIAKARSANIKIVVATGRPLIVDDELSLSDAFVSIWHPGTAVEGINDVIFSNPNNTINYNFTGKLPYSWPGRLSINPLNIGDKEYNPLYEYGYGLSYRDQ